MSTSVRRYRVLHPYHVIIAHDRTSIYASAPFKFIIDGNPLYIHAELVSRNSKPLDRMINGYMSEAQEGFAVIKDVDEGTFVRFIQWAYNRYYEAGKFKIDSSRPDSALPKERMAGEPCPEELAPAGLDTMEEPVMEELVMEDVSSWREASVEYPYGWPNPPSHGKFGRKGKRGSFGRTHDNNGASSPSRQRLKESFINRQPTVRQQAISICPSRPNQAANEDYTEVFLSHARVYVFAEEYDIQTLKALALDELHGTLQNFSLYPERTGDIIALLRYVYANTGEPVDGVEDMRTVLQQYVGFEMDDLMKDKGFEDLMMEDGGALLGDFLKMVKQRL